MSRLESIAKAGYFPTPPDVVQGIAGFIHPTPHGPQRTTRLIDPCCGTGAALRQLADTIGGETYGVEIARDRVEDARGVLDHTLHASGLTARVAPGAFSCLLLNPPYDDDDESKRLEHRFLLETSRILCPRGLLVFIVPQRRLEISARYLAGHFQNLACFRFPDPEFASFRQVVLFGVKRASAVNDPAGREQVIEWSNAESLAVLPNPGDEDETYELPTLRAGPVTFSSLFFDPGEAVLEARNHGLWANRVLMERIWPPEDKPVRPLMPLRRGHLAVLVTAGFLNNIVLEGHGRRLLVKGRTYKESIEVDSDDPETKVERDVIRTSVVALDLDTAEFEIVQQSGAKPPSTSLAGSTGK